MGLSTFLWGRPPSPGFKGKPNKDTNDFERHPYFDTCPNQPRCWAARWKSARTAPGQCWAARCRCRSSSWRSGGSSTSFLFFFFGGGTKKRCLHPCNWVSAIGGLGVVVRIPLSFRAGFGDISVRIFVPLYFLSMIFSPKICAPA